MPNDITSLTFELVDHSMETKYHEHYLILNELSVIRD